MTPLSIILFLSKTPEELIVVGDDIAVVVVSAVSLRQALAMIALAADFAAATAALASGSWGGSKKFSKSTRRSWKILAKAAHKKDGRA